MTAGCRSANISPKPARTRGPGGSTYRFFLEAPRADFFAVLVFFAGVLRFLEALPDGFFLVLPAVFFFADFFPDFFADFLAVFLLDPVFEREPTDLPVDADLEELVLPLPSSSMAGLPVAVCICSRGNCFR